jgi:acetoin utilization deacetylase AcuC-like enzyme
MERMAVGLVWHDAYLAHEAPQHVERPDRLRAVRDGLTAAGLWDRLTPIEARPAEDADLLRAHTPGHVERVRRTSGAAGLVWFDADTYAGPASARAAWLAAGGVCAAADAVLRGDVAAAFCPVRPPGHHACPDRAMGFCLINNVAVAARRALETGGLQRVLIVDWDVHHGNGTQEVFWRDGRVMYVSTHQSPLYPGTGWPEEKGEGKAAGLIRNYPLRPGSGDAELLAALDDALAAAAEFRPQLVFISAGFDAHRDDPLASLAITDAGFAEAARRVRRLADETCAGRVVSVLEGGYNVEVLARAAVAHVRALMEPASTGPKKE